MLHREIYGAAYLAYREIELHRFGAKLDTIVNNSQPVHIACVIRVGSIKRERSVLCKRDPVRKRYAVGGLEDIGICAAAEIIS